MFELNIYILWLTRPFKKTCIDVEDWLHENSSG